MTYAIAGLFLMGVSVGCKFKVAALVVVSLSIVLMNIILHQLSVLNWNIALSTIAFLVSLQAGYVVGVFLSLFLIRRPPGP